MERFLGGILAEAIKKLLDSDWGREQLKKVDNYVKNLIALAASSATTQLWNKIKADLPGLGAAAEVIGDIAQNASDVRADLDRLVPDFDTGVKPLDDILDFWRPR